MKIIKKIIIWLINLLKKIFGYKKVHNKLKSSFNNKSNKHYFKEYKINNNSVNNPLPLYLFINESQKDMLLKKIRLIEEKLENESNDIIDKIKKEITSSKISFYQNELISEKIENILQDKKSMIDTKEKIVTLDKEIIDILENYDKNIKEKTKREYGVVNYVTLTTLLLDETNLEIKNLKEDFHHHKYNKHYYEKEIKKIKSRIDYLKSIMGNESVKKEIEELKKDLYTKRYDKYDLLYNEEAFLGLDKICDDLLKKVNKRVIDLKKEKEDKKVVKEEKNNDKDKRKHEKEFLENILKRFQDIELARKILLLSQNNEKEINNPKELLSYTNSIYLEFIAGEKFKFNYERNKTKLEIVKLINNMGKMNSIFDKQEYVLLEHINYSMSDLVTFALDEKEKLDNVMEEKFNYQKEKDELNILVQNKLNLIAEKEIEKEKGHILVKTNNEK